MVGNVPENLRWLEQYEDGRDWLRALPGIVSRCTARWGLVLDTPYTGGSVSYVVRATRADGAPVVLKVGFPDPESRHEGEALRRWDGRGAVRLYEEAPEDGALLLERCLPGDTLETVGVDEALRVLAGLVARTWVPAGVPFGPLAEAARTWAASLPRRWERTGRPFEAGLLDAAVAWLADPAAVAGEQVLVNQDLHPGNVLAAEREAWLCIDPKPLVGPREFGLASVVRAAELGHRRDAVVDRLDRLAVALRVDRERTRRWALAHAIAWGFEGDRVIEGHVEVARWLWQAAPVGRVHDEQDGCSGQ